MSADDFAALEHATPIVQVADGVATTTSMRIANGTGNEHASVLLLIRKNLDDFNEFGLVRFEIAPRPAGQHGGGDVSIAVLNEEHATLLLTYMRNNDIVRDFKKRLVREFYAMRAQLSGRAAAPAIPQTREQRLALALVDATDIIAEQSDQIKALEEQREIDRPAIEYVNTHVVVTDDVMLVEDWGRTYGLTKPQAFALLRDVKKLIYPKVFERWSRTQGCKVTETEYRPTAGKQAFTWFDVKEQRNAPRRNNGQARKTLYIKAVHAVDLARLVGLIPNIEAAS